MFEVGYIQRPWCIGSPAKRLLICMQEVVSIGEAVPQSVHQIAQVSVSLSIGRIRPEQKGKMRAGLGYRVMEHEVGEQRMESWPINGRHGCVIRDKQELT